MKEYAAVVTSSKKCKITTCIPLKTVLTENQDCLLLQNIAK